MLVGWRPISPCHVLPFHCKRPYSVKSAYKIPFEAAMLVGLRPISPCHVLPFHCKRPYSVKSA